MNIVHLLASPFYGGPERQVLGLSRQLPDSTRTSFLSFKERGLARAFLDRARQEGFDAIELEHNWPHFFRAIDEVASCLRDLGADLLCTSGYKPDLIGWRAARRVGIPVVAIAHGWTAATWKVRVNEGIDRWVMRHVDCVVSVSDAQAAKVRKAGVSPERMVTIHNAVDPAALVGFSQDGRAVLEGFFASPPRIIVTAAGRFSPEKGFDVLIDAASEVIKQHPEVGFVLLGDGPLRDDLTRRIAHQRLEGRFILGGFRTDLDSLLGSADVHVLSSHTEGLPVIILEAMAAGVPVVATRVGGVPEVIEDGLHGFLAEPGNAASLAEKLNLLAADSSARRSMGGASRLRIAEQFSSSMQAQRYHELFDRLTGNVLASTSTDNGKGQP